MNAAEWVELDALVQDEIALVEQELQLSDTIVRWRGGSLPERNPELYKWAWDMLEPGESYC
jgi:hypothetical protein